MSDDRTVPLRNSEVPTAFDRICFDPTLFLGSAVTAYDVPPSAMNTAAVAITFAYVRCGRICRKIRREGRELRITDLAPQTRTERDVPVSYGNVDSRGIRARKR